MAEVRKHEPLDILRCLLGKFLRIHVSGRIVCDPSRTAGRHPQVYKSNFLTKRSVVGR